MKVIDLLNKIANGEEIPKYIKYYDILHQKKDKMMCCYNNIIYKLDNNIIDLLDEVEIIEEDKKINKIRVDYNSINIDKAFETGTTTFFREKDIEIFQCLSSKINEIIDVINEMKKD